MVSGGLKAVFISFLLNILAILSKQTDITSTVSKQTVERKD
jgi:hypothetical protein